MVFEFVQKNMKTKQIVKCSYCICSLVFPGCGEYYNYFDDKSAKGGFI